MVSSVRSSKSLTNDLVVLAFSVHLHVFTALGLRSVVVKTPNLTLDA